MVIHTIGHSTRTIDEFLALLRAHGIARLVDVRRYAASRRHPHFAADALERTLITAGIRYRHEPELGGRRTPSAGSPNTAWRSASFRGYADYLATVAFHAALERLLAHATTEPTAIMCAEAVPWRCHRQLIADVLVTRGHEVRHITGATRAEPHCLNPHAIVGPTGIVTYPASTADQQSLL